MAIDNHYNNNDTSKNSWNKLIIIPRSTITISRHIDTCNTLIKTRTVSKEKYTSNNNKK